jgi:hypothetical protein
MGPRIEQALGEIEAASAGIEAAWLAGDWQATGLGNEYLEAKLERFATLLAAADGPIDSGSIALATARLAGVLEQHVRLWRQLASARDAAGDELRGLRLGRRATDHYSDTASGTA